MFDRLGEKIHKNLMGWRGVGWVVVSPRFKRVCMYVTTAVKRLNRYFCFLLLRFHLPVREKWAKMYKSVSQHNYLSIFLKILSFFR